MKLKKLPPDHPASTAQNRWDALIAENRARDLAEAEAASLDSPLSSAPASPSALATAAGTSSGKAGGSDRVKCPECGGKVRYPDGRGPGHKLTCSKSSGAQKRNALLVSDPNRKRALSDASSDVTGPATKKKKTAPTVPESGDDATPAPPDGSAPAAPTTSAKKKYVKKADKEKAGGTTDKDKDGKEKKQPKKKSGRVKGPVDVNVQCGVITPDGTPCARSLTCKTHSMGAKRSVPGRSASYDVLLNEWQKLHNPNWGDRKVVTPRVGPGIEPGQSKKKKKEAAQLAASSHASHHSSAAAAAAAADPKLLGEIDRDFGPLRPTGSGNEPAGGYADVDADAEDSDDEVDLVMRGLAASAGGRPVAEPGMGSAWLHRWSRFGKFGVRETYREAFLAGAAVQAVKPAKAK